MAESRAADENSEPWMDGKVEGETNTHTKNAPAAINTIPAASPSRPSMRFTAFTRMSTQRIVSGTDRSGPNDMTPWLGNQKKRS
jgi:hypothetical protein